MGAIIGPHVGPFNTKPTERVREEVRIVKQSGARAIQVAELGHIPAAPKAAEGIKEAHLVR